MLSWMFQHDYLDTYRFECLIIMHVLCFSYFFICTCSAQLSMFHMERRSRNTLIVIIIINVVRPRARGYIKDIEHAGKVLRSCLFVCCLTSQQHASVSQGRICSDNCTCCHTETEVADQTFHLTQSQYTDTGPTSPRTDPITPGAWQGSHWSANFYVTGMTRPRKNPIESGIRTRDLPLPRLTP